MVKGSFHKDDNEENKKLPQVKMLYEAKGSKLKKRDGMRNHCCVCACVRLHLCIMAVQVSESSVYIVTMQSNITMQIHLTVCSENHYENLETCM